MSWLGRAPIGSGSKLPVLIGIATASLLALTMVCAAAENISALFGSRAVENPRFKAPYVIGDLDGDGVPDSVYLVTVRPQSAPTRFAKDVTVMDIWDSKPLGVRGEALALAVVLGKDKRKFVLTGADYFATPIWSQSPVPLTLAKRGSKAFRDFQKQERRIKNDVIVTGTEAGIDIALYWDGAKFVLFRPLEDP